MSADTVRALLNPTSIAVVGASEDSMWATSFFNNLTKWNYPGRLHLVNPRRDQVYGQKAYPSVEAIPEPVDHALIVVRAALVPSVLEDCGRAGVRGATIVASGFNEEGEEGSKLAEQVLTVARRYGIEATGPNCYGFVNFEASTVLSRNYLEVMPAKPGRISMVFQSGQLNQSACSSAEQRDIGMRYSVSSGNELITDANDYFEFFLEDEGTAVIGGALEQIPDPRRFERIAHRALELGKPIVLLKLGASEAASKVAASHTGAVTGDAAVVEAYLRELGVIVVSDIDRLVETAGLLDRQGWPEGGRTVFAGTSGGAGEYFADLADGTSIRFTDYHPDTRTELAEIIRTSEDRVLNPLDMTATGGGELVAVTSALTKRDDFDVLILMAEELRSVDVQGERAVKVITHFNSVADDLRRQGVYALLASPIDRPVTPLGREVRAKHPVTYLHGSVGVEALHHAIAYGTDRQQKLERVAAIIDSRGVSVTQTSDRGGAWSEVESKAFLDGNGIAVTRDLRASSEDEALAAANELGYPVVLKLESPHVAHKSEIGGVVVGIRTDAELIEARRGILARAADAYPDRSFDSVLVCEQITGATELIVGAIVDPDLGPVIMVGAGGIYVEVMKDAALSLPPVDPEIAERMVRSLKMWPILAGARGKKPADLEALKKLLVATSDMVVSLGGQLSELDINPVFVSADRVVAGDALIVTT